MSLEKLNQLDETIYRITEMLEKLRMSYEELYKAMETKDLDRIFSAMDRIGSLKVKHIPGYAVISFGIYEVMRISLGTNAELYVKPFEEIVAIALDELRTYANIIHSKITEAQKIAYEIREASKEESEI